MAPASREASRPDQGGRPLDPDRPESGSAPQAPEPEPTPATTAARAGDGAPTGDDDGAARTGAGAPAGDDAGTASPPPAQKRTRSRAKSGEKAPGLRAQARSTIDALTGLVRAHVELGKAEAEEIKGEVQHAAAFGAIALAALLLLGVFLPIVGMLFLGEWLFGSIGWGVLLGSEMLLSVALTAVLIALRVGGIGRAVLVAFVAGIVAFVILGAGLPHQLWGRIAESSNLAIDPAVQPLLIAMAIVGGIGALLGLVGGARATGFGGAVVGLFGGLVAGALLGAFLAVDFGWRVGAALGFAVAYATYVTVLGARAASKGIDQEQLKARFWPQTTIETTRETIEWAKERNPLGPRS